MNETQLLIASRANWTKVFSEFDRLVVDSLIRYASRAIGIVHIDDSDADAVLSLLLLVKSVRLEHVAMPLNPDDLGSLVADELWSENADHEFPPDDSLSSSIIAALSMPRQPWLRELIEIVDPSVEISPEGPPIVVSFRDGPRFAYLRRMAYAEDVVANILIKSTKSLNVTTYGASELSIDDVTQIFSSTSFRGALPSDEARLALARMLTFRVSVLTGGPGTGKTTAVATMLHALGSAASKRDSVVRVALCAPTAKAAVRMNQAIEEAFEFLDTTHEARSRLIFDERNGSVQRLLKMNLETMDAQRILDHDLVVIDEVSMLDLALLEQVLRSCGPTTHILLIGDPNQLASVRVGAVLREIVDSAANGGPLHSIVSTLTHNFRSGDAVVELANAINNNDAEAVRQAFESSSASAVLLTNRDQALTRTVQWATSLIEQASLGNTSRAIETLGERAVLCATRNGDGSVDWWRSHVTQRLEHAGLIGDERLAVGVPIMITRNEQRVGTGASQTLNNGDLGVVVRSDGVDLAVFAPQNPLRTRPPSEIDQFDTAWAITIHKSQGSEYDEVVISLPERDLSLLTRELLYTAVTRARRSVVVLATFERVVAIMNRRIRRVGGLVERLEAKSATSSA